MMMVPMLLAGLAQADPGALRGPHAAPTAVVGLHDISIGTPLPKSSIEVGVSLRADRGAVSAVVGRRWTLAEGDRGWAAHAGVSGGVLVPIVVPTVGVTVIPWVSAGPSGERAFLQGVIAAPVAVALTGARLPLLFELQGGLHLGPITVGPRLAIGPAWAPGTDVSVVTEGAILLSYRRR